MKTPPEITQQRLSKMAWDAMGGENHPGRDMLTVLQLHLQKMLEILRSPDGYRRLFETETETPCPYCYGTGKYHEDEAKATIRKTVAELQNNPEFLALMRKSLHRCPKCNSSGFLSVKPKTYCDCQMGRDIEATERRMRDEDAWNLAQQPPERTRPI